MEENSNNYTTESELMSPRAKFIFDSTVKSLKKLKNYVDIDEKLIQAYAVEMATYEKAAIMCQVDSEVVTAPNGYLMINHWYQIRTKSLKAAMDIAKLFGFTPVVRKALGNKQEKETPEFNILSQRKTG